MSHSFFSETPCAPGQSRASLARLLLWIGLKAGLVSLHRGWARRIRKGPSMPQMSAKPVGQVFGSSRSALLIASALTPLMAAPMPQEAGRAIAHGGVPLIASCGQGRTWRTCILRRPLDAVWQCVEQAAAMMGLRVVGAHRDEGSAGLELASEIGGTGRVAVRASTCDDHRTIVRATVPDESQSSFAAALISLVRSLVA